MDTFSELPRWVLDLPEHIRPSPAAAAAFEELRKKFEFEHHEFAAHIAAHPSSIAKDLQHTADAVRSRTRGISEEDALRLAFQHRASLAFQAGHSSLLGLTTNSGDDDYRNVLIVYPTVKQLAEVIADELRQGADRPRPVPGLTPLPVRSGGSDSGD